MITVSNPPSTVSVPVATTAEEGKTKVDNNMTGDPIALTTHSRGIPSGVAELDAGGLVPVAELPSNLAYTDIVNTFTQNIDITDGTNLNTVSPTEILIDDGFGSTLEASTSSISLTNLTLSTEIDAGDIEIRGTIPSIFLDDFGVFFSSITSSVNGIDTSFNNLPPSEYFFDGAATNIHQDKNGSIHLQVAPVGVASDPITWTDAVVINNDGTITLNTPLDSGSLPTDTAYTDAANTFTLMQTLDTGITASDIFSNQGQFLPNKSTMTDVTGAYSQMDSGGITVIDSTSHGASIGSGTGFLDGVDPAYWILDTTDTSLRGSMSVTGTGVDITNGITPSPTPGNFFHYPHADKGSGVHLDIDGSITLRTAPAASIGSPVVWTDVLTANADGTIDLASTPTTTTAPAAGMADALPALPTEYATIEVNGTPRQIAVY